MEKWHFRPMPIQVQVGILVLIKKTIVFFKSVRVFNIHFIFF